MTDSLIIAGKEYKSRLIVGTGKYKDFEETKLAVEASGAEIVTVAVRRVNISKSGEPMLPRNILTFPTQPDVLPVMMLFELFALPVKPAVGIL